MHGTRGPGKRRRRRGPWPDVILLGDGVDFLQQQQSAFEPGCLWHIQRRFHRGAVVFRGVRIGFRRTGFINLHTGLQRRRSVQQRPNGQQHNHDEQRRWPVFLGGQPKQRHPGVLVPGEQQSNHRSVYVSGHQQLRWAIFIAGQHQHDTVPTDSGSPCGTGWPG